jgi:hypothetical protein
MMSMDETSTRKVVKQPTPAEIAACCAEIRSQWNYRTFRLRAGLPPSGVPLEMRITSFAAPTRRRSSTVEID